MLGRKHDNMKLDFETTREILRDTKEYGAFGSIGSDFFFFSALSGATEEIVRLNDKTDELFKTIDEQSTYFYYYLVRD